MRTVCTLASAAALIMRDCNMPSRVVSNENKKAAGDVELWTADLVIQDGSDALSSSAAQSGHRRTQADPADASPNLYWTLYSSDVQSSLYNWTLFMNATFSASDTGFFSAYVFSQLQSYASNVNLGMTTAAEVDIDQQWQSVPGASFSPTGNFPSGQFPASVPRASSQWWQSSCGSVTLSTFPTVGSNAIMVRG